jgi:hypothetical protein
MKQGQYRPFTPRRAMIGKQWRRNILFPSV